MLLRVLGCAAMAHGREGEIAVDHRDPTCNRALTVSVIVKCHPAHMFSRRWPRRSYRNLIKAAHGRTWFSESVRLPRRCRVSKSLAIKWLFQTAPRYLEILCCRCLIRPNQTWPSVRILLQKSTGAQGSHNDAAADTSCEVVRIDYAGMTRCCCRWLLTCRLRQAHPRKDPQATRASSADRW
jgi:hypothetical protein